MSLLVYKILAVLAFIGIIITGTLYNMDLESDKDKKEDKNE